MTDQNITYEDLHDLIHDALIVGKTKAEMWADELNGGQLRHLQELEIMESLCDYLESKGIEIYD